MKKRIIYLVLILIAFSFELQAQEKNESIDSVSIQSDTSYAEVTYDFTYDGSKHYDGVVGYIFTVTDTITQITLEGSYDGETYVVIDTLGLTVAGNYKISDVDPEFLKNRLGFYGASGDTATAKNIRYYEKLSKQ
jgi:hypothetical protein